MVNRVTIHSSLTRCSARPARTRAWRAALMHDETAGPLGFKLRFVTAQSLVGEKAVEVLEYLVNGAFFQARIRFVLSLLRIFGETTVWFIAVTPMIYASG